jgi:predicted glycosyltransferase
MNILIDIIHPAHVHFFRYAISEFEKRGHKVAVTARQKDVTIELLTNFGIPFTVLSKVGKGRWGLLWELVTRDIKLWKFCRSFHPDVLTGISGAFVAHVGAVLHKPSIVWDDTEHQKLAHLITWPLATEIHNPDSYSLPCRKKQHFYPGCHDLAYLHPKRFTPSADVVKQVGIEPEEKFCIIRFVSWGAHHDVGQHGFDEEKKLRFVEALAEYARPYITSEGPLPAELAGYQLKIPPHQFHHVLAFASLCVAEGATVASEAAVLGTPSVYINTLKAGCLDMFAEYGLMKQTIDTDEALELSIELLKDEDAKEKCRSAREKFLADKIDVTDYIVETVERAGAVTKGSESQPRKEQV